MLLSNQKSSLLVHKAAYAGPWQTSGSQTSALRLVLQRRWHYDEQALVAITPGQHKDDMRMVMNIYYLYVFSKLLAEHFCNNLYKSYIS